MASDKSLAAEIEAVIGDPVAVHLNMLRGTIAKPSIENIIHLYGRDALLAALQSRAFEDGARWMRERAAKTADYARQRAALALQGGCDGSDTNRTRRDLAQSLKGQIQALPLQPEGERSDA